MWNCIFLITRKYLEFFFPLFGSIIQKKQRILLSWPSLLIMNTFISPLTSFPLTRAHPSAFSQPDSRESFQHSFKTKMRLCCSIVLCTVVIFILCLERVCGPELSSSSLQQSPACRAHPAKQPFSHGAGTDKLCQMSLPWFQIFMLTAVHLTVLLELLSACRDQRGARVCTGATFMHTDCWFKLPVKSLCPHLRDCRLDCSLPVEGQGVRLSSGNIQKCGSFVLQRMWIRAQTTCTKKTGKNGAKNGQLHCMIRF